MTKEKAKVASEAVSPETSAEETKPEVVTEPKPKKVKKTSFTVYKNGYPVRTYSVEEHGENAEDLANEFIAHAGGEIISE